MSGFRLLPPVINCLNDTFLFQTIIIRSLNKLTKNTQVSVFHSLPTIINYLNEFFLFHNKSSNKQNPYSFNCVRKTNPSYVSTLKKEKVIS